MRMCKYCFSQTPYIKDRYNEYFVFRGKKYRLYSIVRLTKEGQEFLQSNTREVVLTAQNDFGKYTIWHYWTRHRKGFTGYAESSVPIDKLVECVVMEASVEHSSKYRLGPNSPYCKVGRKYGPNDLTDPYLLKGWAVLILACFVSLIFKQFYYAWACCILLFWTYRHEYITPRTSYIRDEDLPMLRACGKIINSRYTTEAINFE